MRQLNLDFDRAVSQAWRTIRQRYGTCTCGQSNCYDNLADSIVNRMESVVLAVRVAIHRGQTPLINPARLT